MSRPAAKRGAGRDDNVGRRWLRATLLIVFAGAACFSAARAASVVIEDRSRPAPRPAPKIPPPATQPSLRLVPPDPSHAGTPTAKQVTPRLPAASPVVPKAVKSKPKPCDEGVASYYGRWHHGRRTANGERFDMRALTAAHRSLPLGTKVKLTNLRNGKSLVVRINDRGPYVRGRALDVSREVARQLGFLRAGTARLRIEPLQPGVVLSCADWIPKKKAHPKHGPKKKRRHR